MATIQVFLVRVRNIVLYMCIYLPTTSCTAMCVCDTRCWSLILPQAFSQKAAFIVTNIHKSMNHRNITQCISLSLLITNHQPSTNQQFLTFQSRETHMATRWICPATWRSFAPDVDGGHSALLAVERPSGSMARKHVLCPP